ncbi:hypothetical protein [Nocardioides iriomotensis]|uniref:hypothetical protein n=1 Tax=Nocardioides iriomotensis TaxID=715784 RepID=UPI0013EC6366|nr:hypothetical protein [Nocardioides iriomotensis]
MRGLKDLVDRLNRQSQERARANARAAATELSRARVEREEVELFLAAHAPRRRVSRTA